MEFKPEEKSRYKQLKKADKIEETESYSASALNYIIQKMLSLKKELLEFDDENCMSYPGLPFMLANKYFDDGFILHDESEGHKEYQELLANLLLDESYDNYEINKKIESNVSNDLLTKKRRRDALLKN